MDAQAAVHGERWGLHLQSPPNGPKFHGQLRVLASPETEAWVQKQAAGSPPFRTRGCSEPRMLPALTMISFLAQPTLETVADPGDNRGLIQPGIAATGH